MTCAQSELLSLCKGSYDAVLDLVLLGFWTSIVIWYSEQNTTVQKLDLLPISGAKVGCHFSLDLEKELMAISEPDLALSSGASRVSLTYYTSLRGP